MKKVFSVLIVLLSFFMVFPAFAEDRLIDKDADWWAQATPEVVENMIKDETDVNVRNRRHFTPLMLAAIYCPNTEVIETLIQHGANVNARFSDGITVLMMAVRRNPNPAVIDTLLKNGASISDDIDKHDKKGKSILDYAKENPKFYNTKEYKQLEEAVK